MFSFLCVSDWANFTTDFELAKNDLIQDTRALHYLILIYDIVSPKQTPKKMHFAI